MENSNTDSGVNTILIVMILLLVVGAGVWWMMMRGAPSNSPGVPNKVNVDIKLPTIPNSTPTSPSTPPGQ